MSMKKILIVLFLLTSSFVFSQDQYRDYNGEDWFDWDPSQRTAFVEGFFAAFASVHDRYHEEAEMNGEEVSESGAEFADDYFKFDYSTNVLMQRINMFYTGPARNLEVSIIEVILIAGEKDYWN